jgi:diguanylate cyclase
VSLALHAIDIDQFKNINDTRGHPAGDELIRVISRRLLATVREGDTVARLGGDEFVVLQAGIGQAVEAERLAAWLLSDIERPCDILGQAAHLSAASGSSPLRPEASNGKSCYAERISRSTKQRPPDALVT